MKYNEMKYNEMDYLIYPQSTQEPKITLLCAPDHFEQANFRFILIFLFFFCDLSPQKYVRTPSVHG